MTKIQSIKFKDHPILGDLALNFCDSKGNIADTIIIAGENGTGKTTILKEIRKIMQYHTDCKNLELKVLCDISYKTILYYGELEHYGTYGNIPLYNVREVQCNNDRMIQYSTDFMSETKFNYIYSSTNINFSPTVKIRQIKAHNLDNNTNRDNEKEFNENTAANIKQLFVDITNYDNKIIADKARENRGKKITEEMLQGRMDRFKNAFNFMFDNLEYKGIDTSINENIEILFEKNGKEISIDDLSSGEKQIVFRGAFLLQNKEALNGAVVLIDEPEISMHPEWQKKIMEFYKKIFQDKDGNQTSQIIVVTHSPFIIHNENRYSDKVIVLKQDEQAKIVVSDKPEYYNADTVQAVEDAFNIQDFLSIYRYNENIVFLEGKTDEQYFNKTIEVFNIKDLPFEFKWIGYIGKNNQEEFTGKDALNKAYSFWKGYNYSGKKVFLYDCDTNKSNEEKNNCYVRVLCKNTGNKTIQIGIENLLKDISDYIDNNREQFYPIKEKKEKDGSIKKIEEFDKQELCDFICRLDNEKLKIILSNLKTEIEELKNIFQAA